MSGVTAGFRAYIVRAFMRGTLPAGVAAFFRVMLIAQRRMGFRPLRYKRRTGRSARMTHGAKRQQRDCCRDTKNSLHGRSLIRLRSSQSVPKHDDKIRPWSRLLA